MRLVMSELHAGVHISNKEVAVQPNFAIHNVENEVFSFYIEAWIQRHQQSPRIVILKVVCRFVVLLLSTTPASPFLPRVFFAFGNFAHFCVALLNAPPSDRESWSIVIDARRCSCPIACGLRRRDNLLAWGDVVCEPLWAKISNLILGGIWQIWANLLGT